MRILALDVGTSALTQPGSPMLDPSFLGGDRLEIEAHRASFRDLTLTNRSHRSIGRSFGRHAARPSPSRSRFKLGRQFRACLSHRRRRGNRPALDPEYASEKVRLFQECSLRSEERRVGKYCRYQWLHWT